MPDKNRSPKLYKSYQESGECCRYCLEEIPFELITKDHFHTPKSEGGTLAPEKKNLIFACRFCNNLKGPRLLKEFKEHVLTKMRTLLDNIQFHPHVELNHRTYRLNRLLKLARILKSIQELINMEKYFLKKDGEENWHEVTKEQWIKAERQAGFRPELSSDDPQYMKTCATSGFYGNGIHGKVEYDKKKL